ncbi:MAG TPA: LysM domain-containing protein [Acidimicrobiales bacterium]|nr:LysM domain-containing protein [Acidimicrobiales bacterium]
MLAEQLVAYPPSAQRIWLEPSAEPHQTEAVAPGSRAYADAWLERELERLRARRAWADERVETGATRPALRRAAASTQAVGDPATPSCGRAPAGQARRTAVLAPSAGTVRRTAPAARPAAGLRGLRRLLPGAATLAVLVSAWFGVGALASSAHATRIERLPGSVLVGGRYLYVARPGDTLWSIATRVEPGADPRPLVDQLEAQLHGRQLQPGDGLLLPR